MSKDFRIAERSRSLITKIERMIKEDMAEYILEELTRFDCIPDEKRATAMNVITKSLIDIRRHKCREKSPASKPGK